MLVSDGVVKQQKKRTNTPKRRHSNVLGIFEAKHGARRGDGIFRSMFGNPITEIPTFEERKHTL